VPNPDCWWRFAVTDRTFEQELDEDTVLVEHLQPVNDPDPPPDEQLDGCVPLQPDEDPLPDVQFDGGFPLQPDEDPDPPPDVQLDGGLPLQPDDDPLPLVQVGGGGVVELVPVQPVWAGFVRPIP
jgi:hypothetical protein